MPKIPKNIVPIMTSRARQDTLQLRQHNRLLRRARVEFRARVQHAHARLARLRRHIALRRQPRRAARAHVRGRNQRYRSERARQHELIRISTPRARGGIGDVDVQRGAVREERRAGRNNRLGEAQRDGRVREGGGRGRGGDVERRV